MPTASSRWSASRLALAALALGAAAVAQAEPAAVIREIVFRGNEVTEPSTMLREMTVHVGDPADPREIERSRQGVQDLGLFRSVKAEQEPVDGGVRLVISVKEKYYILPFPRVYASTDGGYGWGMQVRWNNVWGLNHSLNPFFERRQPSEGDDDPEIRGLQTRWVVTYDIPFLAGSEYGLGLGWSYTETPYLEPISYEQTSTAAAVSLSRKLSGGHGSQGWAGRAGLAWAEEVTTGPEAPPAKGHAVALTAGAQYRDLHFNVYSDTGTILNLDVRSATRDIASDYHFTSWGLTVGRYLAVGDTPHQTLHVLLEAAARHDGHHATDAYAVGGTGTLRGYGPEAAKGDAYYVVRLEFLRPVFRKSIRALVAFDAGNAFAEPGDAHLDKIYTSAGLGVRLRIQAFVALDLELGMAWPLDGGSPRVFASKL